MTLALTITAVVILYLITAWRCWKWFLRCDQRRWPGSVNDGADVAITTYLALLWPISVIIYLVSFGAPVTGPHPRHRRSEPNVIVRYANRVARERVDDDDDDR